MSFAQMENVIHLGMIFVFSIFFAVSNEKKISWIYTLIIEFSTAFFPFLGNSNLYKLNFLNSFKTT